jgi:hypothetical protein
VLGKAHLDSEVAMGKIRDATVLITVWARLQFRRLFGRKNESFYMSSSVKSSLIWRKEKNETLAQQQKRDLAK